METRLTLRPGQHGTKKLVERFGQRLVVDERPWQPRARRLRCTPDDVVVVRIGHHET